MTSGIIFDIQKFSIHDGPGIRTTVFFKGCPLRCLWCHNPESQKHTREIFFTPAKCIGCGNCLSACPAGCHTFEDTIHCYDRSRCATCGKCTDQCFAGALETAGREAAVEEVIAEVLKDKVFYDNSGGGITLSGGEPMAQPEFALELAKAAKAENLHLCLDTCGCTDFENYRKILPYVDIFLFDLKAMDDARHRELTGVSNRLILENLHRIDEAGGVTILRCPLIPGLNDDESHLRAIGETASSLSNVREITLHPYHPLGISKSQRLGISPAYAVMESAPPEAKSRWLEIISSTTAVPVRLN